jgi:diguanylate cyclase (GGDEF)-like protein
VLVVVILLAVAFGLAAAYTAGMAVLDWRRRRRSAAFRVVAIVSATTSITNVLGLGQLVVTGPAAATVGTAQIIVAIITASAVVCMSMVQSDRAWRLSRTTALLLGLVPAAMTVVAVTPAWNHLLAFPPGADGIPVAGPALLACLVYSQLLLAGSAIRLLVLRRRATSAEQRRICTRALITYLPPIAFGALGAALPVDGVNLIPIGQALSVVYLHVAWIGSMTRHMPVAHRTIFHSISDGVTVVDPTGRILEMNPAAQALLRRLMPDVPDDLTSLTVTELGLEPSEDGATEQTLQNVGDSGIDLHVQINPVRDQRDTLLGWILVGRDITESSRARRRAEEDAERLREQLETIQSLQASLAEQANRDVLTGLHNRRYLMDRLQRDAARGEISLAVIDIDHFKGVNDRYGHAGGDTALVHTGQLLAGAVRDGDLVVRYGGEEFVIVFYGIGPATAWSRIDAVRERLARTPVELGGRSVTLTLSAGVSGAQTGYDVDDLLRQADDAMYEAKRRGRNRTELYGHIGVSALA